MEIDDNILIDFIERELNLYNPCIRSLTYRVIDYNSPHGVIEYTYIDEDNERQYGLMKITQYKREKREKSLKKIL